MRPVAPITPYTVPRRAIDYSDRGTQVESQSLAQANKHPELHADICAIDGRGGVQRVASDAVFLRLLGHCALGGVDGQGDRALG